MKKAVSVLFLITVSLFVWAADYNVLIYPANNELSHYIQTWFPTSYSNVPAAGSVPVRYHNSEVINAGSRLTTAWKLTEAEAVKKAQAELEKAQETFIDDKSYSVKLVSYSGPVTAEDAFKLDPQVLSYLCSQTNADLLIIPGEQRMDDLYILTIDVWSEALQTTDRVFMEIRQNSELYNETSVLALAPYFLDEERLAEFSIKRQQVVKENVPEFHLTSDVPAQVWVNNINAGITPITLEHVGIPSIIRLTAEGYSDASLYVDGKSNSEKVSMKPAWMDDSDYYKETRNKFYTDFALALGAFGLRVAARSIDFKDPAFVTGADYITRGFIAAALVNLVYGLFNYYSSAGGMT